MLLSHRRRTACISFASAVVVATSAGPAAAAIQATFYASPAGSGTTCSLAQPCSLTGARDKVRTVNASMSGDIVVYLRGGTYQLASTFTLTESASVHDSGTNGWNVIYKAYPGEAPVLSGGQTVTGWALYDGSKNIYRANVGTSLQTRQLYVNGRRATRAKGAPNPAGFTKTSGGYTLPSTGPYAAMASWGNRGDIEVVSNNEWKSYRCGVATIVGTALTMDSPCWPNSQLHLPMGLPTWIENAYELLDAPGEWYLDRSQGYLYYKPLPQDDLSRDAVVAARLETLVAGAGTLATPLHNVHFSGLTFAYGTWLRPNSSEGYATVQAGFTLTGSNTTWDTTGSSWTKSPSDVTFSAAKSIRFERNRFTHLGGFGLNFEYGSQDNTVVGNVFDDISGSAVQLGDIDDHHPGNAAAIVKNNSVTDNYITDVAAEYLDGVGIWGGYTDGSTVARNEIFDLPYSGISVGWGWGSVDPGGSAGYTTPTTARNNTIRDNRVHRVMDSLADGGAVYTLGAQPGSKVLNNYVSGVLNSSGGLFPDEGTEDYELAGNVIEIVPKWLHIWTSSIQNLSIHDNFSDTASATNNGTNTAVSAHTVVTNGDWPAGAQSVMSGAGIQAAYADIRGTAGVASPSGGAARLKVTNASSGQNYVYKRLSSKSYTFQQGDVVEYDVRIVSNVRGAGGLEILNSDGSYFRDIPGWGDQDGVSGHPLSNLAPQAYSQWHHRKLSVPSSMVGKSAAQWALTGTNDTDGLSYAAEYDNIVVTNGAGQVRTGGSIFTSASDYNASGDVYSSNIATSSLETFDVAAAPMPADELMRLSVTNAGSGQNYVYKVFSGRGYLFRPGDYIEYDVKVSANASGMGAVEIVNSDGTYFRDTPGWQDQNGVSGHPLSNLGPVASGQWFHRKLAVPASMVGKTASQWVVAGANDTDSFSYQADYDNIVVTNGNGVVRLGGTIFRSGMDLTPAGDLYNSNIASSSVGALAY